MFAENRHPVFEVKYPPTSLPQSSSQILHPPLCALGAQWTFRMAEPCGSLGSHRFSASRAEKSSCRGASKCKDVWCFRRIEGAAILVSVCGSVHSWWAARNSKKQGVLLPSQFGISCFQCAGGGVTGPHVGHTLTHTHTHPHKYTYLLVHAYLHAHTQMPNVCVCVCVCVFLCLQAPLSVSVRGCVFVCALILPLQTN